MSFRPDPDLQDALANRRGFSYQRPDYVHRLEDGVGNINLDYYPLTITKLPTDPNVNTPEKLLEYIRTNINTFAKDSGGRPLSDFTPYSARYPSFTPLGVNDVGVWSSSAPRESVISIYVNANRGWLQPAEYASVITARHTLAQGDPHWIFSSAYTLGDLHHPVSGNRQFGILQTGTQQWTFYTMATDRITSGFGPASPTIFAGGDTLWTNLQYRLWSEIKRLGGEAEEPRRRDSARYKWSSVCQTYWRPTVAWTSNNSTTCE